MFRYIHKKVHASGAVERLVQDFSLSEVITGKGGESTIILPGQRVSPAHAKFVWDGNVLSVFDLGSLAGVRVNGRRVSSSSVRSGDTLVLGDVQVEVRIEGDCVELVASVVNDLARSEKSSFVRGLEQLRVESYLPPMRHILIAVATISFVAFAVYPLLAKDFSPWNSGPISNSHSLIAQDCQKCHAEPFVKVQDRECLYCHEMSEHAKDYNPFVHKHPQLDMRCASCHMEHNGDHGLIAKESDFCVGCHSSMQTLQPEGGILNVPHLKDHPQFRVRVVDVQGISSRVAIDDQSKALDGTKIKLNHAVHMKPGLRAPGGSVDLSCNSCHQPDKDYKGVQPISFEKHCQECHSLGFDERLPDSQVPHGDAEAVYPALFTEYTKLSALGSGKAPGPKAGEASRLFPSDEVQAQEVPLQVSSIVENAREAERQLFTKTGCFLCHEYEEKSTSERTETNSRYRIVKPNIPPVWLPGARFSHGAHEEFSCESCHEKVRNSSKTSDILLPGVKLCQQCHAQDAPLGYVESGCVTCHSYHDAIGFPGEKKQTIADYLNSLTR